MHTYIKSTYRVHSSKRVNMRHGRNSMLHFSTEIQLLPILVSPNAIVVCKVHRRIILNAVRDSQGKILEVVSESQ